MRPANRLLRAGVHNAVVTANALRPAGREMPLAPLAFATGLPTSELPLFTAGVQVARTARAIRRDGWRSPRGLVGLGLTALSLRGLYAVHQQAARSEQVLEDALVEGLGARYRERIDEPFSPPPDVPLTRRSILLPSFGTRRRYAAQRNVAYGEYGRRNHLDIWHRTDLPADAGAPVLLQVHGGAWTVGKKEGQAHPLMAHLAERGWVCVTINYRLSPKATWPDHIVDVKRAIAWVKANVGQHGGDPGFLAISGGSAGGHLAALAALTPGLPAFQPGFEDADTRVDVAVPFYGVYDFTDRDGTAGRALGPFAARTLFRSALDDDRPRWEQASPLWHVGPHAPPFFVLHGTNDTVVPVGQARSFVGELRASSMAPVAYAELPGAQHAFDIFPSVRAHHAVHAVERFLAVARSEHGGATPAEAVDAGQA